MSMYLADRGYATCPPDGSCGCDRDPSDDYPELDEEDESLLELHPEWELEGLAAKYEQ